MRLRRVANLWGATDGWADFYSCNSALGGFCSLAEQIYLQEITPTVVAYTYQHHAVCRAVTSTSDRRVGGGRQFKQLCEANSTIHVDRATAAGRTVYLAETPDVEIKGTWVRVVLKPWRFVDAMTGELVVSYNTLQAQGGRFLKVSEGHEPLTFNGYCAPAESPASVETFRPYDINYIEPPHMNRYGEQK